MYQTIEQRLARLINSGESQLIQQSRIGLEKECLRVSPDGSIAQTLHPEILGSALAHTYITTDYSEALTELITPPLPGIGQALDFLRDIQKFVCDHLGDEMLWATSMPCILAGGDSIPIATYGDSHLGTMKTVYRRGLGHRYGRVMQVIAGVHFNYSPAEMFWPLYQTLEQDRGELRHFTDNAFMGLIRNLQRYGWLIPYLFGASPAVCKTFLEGKPTTLEEFDAYTYYEPYATSLRMGDIGYTNSQEEGAGIKANYDSLDAYIASLTHAITTSCPQWERIGVKVNGRYEQLNSNLLQIENEYYSTVRPKQVPAKNEMPTLALRQRGIRYVELRSLDVNAFDPLGISEEQLRFLEAFMLFCLLHDSPPIDAGERREIDQNIIHTAHQGREPGFALQRNGREILLQDWASELCDAMEAVCALLDQGRVTPAYGQALAACRDKVQDPEQTPSALMLTEMRERGEGFFHFAKRMSQEHQRYFVRLQLDAERQRQLEQESLLSLERQLAMEASDTGSFDDYLAAYFRQGQELDAG